MDKELPPYDLLKVGKEVLYDLDKTTVRIQERTIRTS